MWAVLHEVRSEYVQLMVALFLLIAGPGRWLIDAVLARNSKPYAILMLSLATTVAFSTLSAQNDTSPQDAKAGYGSAVASPQPGTVNTEADSSTLGKGTIEVKLTEFKIDMPHSVGAGATIFKVTNTGKETHGFEIEGQCSCQSGAQRKNLPIYWRRGELNPCPQSGPRKHLHVYPVLIFKEPNDASAHCRLPSVREIPSPSGAVTPPSD